LKIILGPRTYLSPAYLTFQYDKPFPIALGSRVFLQAS
jgi:hypothetical protein